MSSPNRIETIAIGDELLTGKISDTNSAYVAKELFHRGVRLFRATVIADSIEELHETMETVAARSRFAIVFGGLGPTSDDKTAEAVARLVGCNVVTHAPSKDQLERIFKERGRRVTDTALKQTLYPEKAEPLMNSEGLAPGFRLEWRGCRFTFVPGVPAEMMAIFRDWILKDLEAQGLYVQQGRILARTWRCVGIPESELQREMDPVERELPPNVWLGYRTKFPENHLTLYVRRESAADEKRFDELQLRLRDMLRRWSYTEQEEELEQIVSHELERRGWRIALAESCTGGLVAQRLTRVPGASKRLWGGATVYQVEAKDRLLGVKLDKPEDAVSQGCTKRLAERVREISGCEVGAAITGYLGPDGGTAEDPMGTLYIAVATPSGIREVKTRQPHRDRERGQWGAATVTLNAIREALQAPK